MRPKGTQSLLAGTLACCCILSACASGTIYEAYERPSDVTDYAEIILDRPFGGTNCPSYSLDVSTINGDGDNSFEKYKNGLAVWISGQSAEVVYNCSPCQMQSVAAESPIEPKHNGMACLCEVSFDRLEIFKFDVKKNKTYQLSCSSQGQLLISVQPDE